jgi:hypothetical protein
MQAMPMLSIVFCWGQVWVAGVWGLGGDFGGFFVGVSLVIVKDPERMFQPAFQVPAMICPGFWCILTSCQLAAGIVLLKLWGVHCCISQALFALLFFLQTKPRVVF